MQVIWYYIAPSTYGTRNLKRHIETCSRRDTHDVGQMLILRNQGSMFISSFKLCPKKFRELLIALVIKHDLHFQFVKYDGIREMIKYLHSDAPLISRNTLKAKLRNLHLREKQKVKSMLNVCLKRICLTFDLWTSSIIDGYMCLTDILLTKIWS